jgi:hypothetical protein
MPPLNLEVPDAPTMAPIAHFIGASVPSTGAKRPMLSADHPAFGQRFAKATELTAPKPTLTSSHTAMPVQGYKAEGIRAGKELLDDEHPLFGKPQSSQPDSDRFEGPVTVGGFFLAINPVWSLPLAKNTMSPSAQLTIKDSLGRASRVRYICRLRAGTGLKVEAILRCQVGWITPRVTFTELPYRIQLGRGLDISVPLLFHFTAVNVLDEQGCATGSCLFFSGTPLLGLSCGFVRITDGELVHAPRRPVDPDTEASHFIGHVHYRQLGFLGLKAFGYVACAVAVYINASDRSAVARKWIADKTRPYFADGTTGGRLAKYVRYFLPVSLCDHADGSKNAP